MRTSKFRKLALIGENRASMVLYNKLKQINTKTTYYRLVNSDNYAKINYDTLVVLMHDCFEYPGNNYWWNRINKNSTIVNNTVGVVTTNKNVSNHKKQIVSAMLHNETMTLGFGWHSLAYDRNGVKSSDFTRVIDEIIKIYFEM